MKKSLLFVLSLALALVSCTRSHENEIPDSNISLIAKTESFTYSKTVADGDVHVCWEPGDEIMVFLGNKTAKFTSDIVASTASATFKGTFGDSSWPDEMDLWAVYPYDEDAAFDGETITTNLPSEQIAREGSFGKDMNLSIAHSKSNILQFYNVGGGIRFSVLEEGIKKVMFEGLGGEIISGNVKIGFSEKGKPEIQGVSGGSQFITLLPPSGQGTFRKDTWYYIVAIPGTLEKGYKLRFYKDTKYARNVSEKVVEIKRNIYISLEKADEAIEYEAQTTHFPETEMEWEGSNNLSLDISKQVGFILDDMKASISDEQISASELATRLTNVDGIIDSYPVGDGVGVVYVQNNGVHINIVLKQPDDFEISESNNSPLQTKSINETSPKKVTPNANRRKALLFAPFQRTGGIDARPIDVIEMENDLMGADFHLSPRLDWDATLDVFSPESLSEYDLIIIQDHGGYGDIFTDTKGNPIRSTYFKTGSVVGYYKMDSSLWENVGVFLSQDVEGTILRYSTTVPLLEAMESFSGKEASFDRSIIIAMACNSYTYDDFADYFIRRGASVYYGNDGFAHQDDVKKGLNGIVKYLCMGMSIDNAMKMMKKKDFTVWGQAFFYGKLSDQPFGTAYLVNPTPMNLRNSEIRDGKTTLIWDQAKTIGDYRLTVHLKGPNVDSAVDATISRAYTTDNLQPGDYSWYVEANLYYDGKKIETFISDTGRFTVKEEEKSVIYYTTSDGIKVKPYPIDWEVNIISNEYKDGQGIITFDGVLTQLPYGAFHSANLTSITLPESLKSLGELCFYQCKDLTSITIPDSVTTIGPQCFGSCTSLASIHLPASLISLDYCCFEFCSSLTTITLPECLTSLGAQCFWACSNLTTITIPASVKIMGDNCFTWCTGLTSVVMNPTIPPAGGQDIFYAANECPIYVPSGCEEVYSTSENWSQYTYRIVSVGGSSVSTPDVVDLGLSVKWANCNLGASYPGGYGYYYAWGEKEPNKMNYSWSTYRWCENSEDYMTKYYSGDGKKKLDPSDDVAHEQLGGTWRMPTESEWKELINNCTWAPYTWEGIDGALATSRVPGHTNATLFFPYSGRKDGYIKDMEDYTGHYWTSSLSPFNSMASIGMTSQDIGYLERYIGLPIRPVYDDK